MENTEIMTNEIVETTGEVVEKTGLSKNVKIVAGVGLGALIGFAVYKYIGKPIIAKVKTKIKQKKMAASEPITMHSESDVVYMNNDD